MTAPVGFDPGARLVRSDGYPELVEVTLWQGVDGEWNIVIEYADETSDEIKLRDDFLVGLKRQERAA